MSLNKSTSEINARSILAVIPTLNEEKHIEHCIRSLMKGANELTEVRLVVADGGSIDRTCEIVQDLQAEFRNLEFISNPKKLQSAAINLAAAQLNSHETQYLVRCDAHSIYPENFILDVVNSLASSDAASLVVPMDAVGSTCFEKANAWIVDTPLGSGGAAHRGGRISKYVDHGHHAGFLFKSFWSLGGYDETFSHNEDAEYDERLRASGGKIFLDATIRIQYVPRGSLTSLAAQYFNYGKGRARNIAKHGQSLRLRQMIPVFALIANVMGTIGGLVFSPLFALPLGYSLVLALASLYVTVKHRSLCGAWAGMAVGAMHMSWALGFISEYFRNKRTTTFPQKNPNQDKNTQRESPRKENDHFA